MAVARAMTDCAGNDHDRLSQVRLDLDEIERLLNGECLRCVRYAQVAA